MVQNHELCLLWYLPQLMKLKGHFDINWPLESFRESPKACVTNFSCPPEKVKGKENSDLPSVSSNYCPPNVALSFCFNHLVGWNIFTRMQTILSGRVRSCNISKFIRCTPILTWTFSKESAIWSILIRE